MATIDQLLDERRLGDCHDHGLVYAAMAREMGCPAVMVRASSIAWIGRFQSGERGTRVGHVFVEVFQEGRWVLIDAINSWYVMDGYDPADPVISLQGPIARPEDESHGFYVERKGIDTWDFGIHSPAESNRTIGAFARQVDLGAIAYPDWTFLRVPRP